MKKKGVGFNIALPSKKCSDKKCPFHGNTGIRGKSFTGIVASDKMARTVIVTWTRRIYTPKYERYEKRRSKVMVHNPECINAKKGDVVLIAETRPLSKTKHFVIIKVLGKESKKDRVKGEVLEEESKSIEKQKDMPLKEERLEKKKAKSEER